MEWTSAEYIKQVIKTTRDYVQINTFFYPNRYWESYTTRIRRTPTESCLHLQRETVMHMVIVKFNGQAT